MRTPVQVFLQGNTFLALHKKTQSKVEGYPKPTLAPTRFAHLVRKPPMSGPFSEDERKRSVRLPKPHSNRRSWRSCGPCEPRRGALRVSPPVAFTWVWGTPCHWQVFGFDLGGVFSHWFPLEPRQNVYREKRNRLRAKTCSPNQQALPRCMVPFFGAEGEPGPKIYTCAHINRSFVLSANSRVRRC